nr:reverse transcriptase domain-containing protein [Tanacetum cinerariifolium]
MMENGLKKKKRKPLTRRLQFPSTQRTEPVAPLKWKDPENQLKSSSVESPKLELKELSEYLEYAFLQENNQIPVVISSALCTIKKSRLLECCMTAIFHELIKDNMEVFMDDFSVFGSSFNHCLKNLENMLKRYEETNLVLNWEKCHFMVKEGIILGHKVSGSKLRRFIKDFSQITYPMTQLLVKDAPFNFFKECIQAFDALKCKLTQTPIMIKPDWSLPFEMMCDSCDYAIRAVLGQRIDKHFKPIRYASKTMNEAQENYTIIKKELLVVVYTFDNSVNTLSYPRLLFSRIILLAVLFIRSDGHSMFSSLV